MKQKLLLVLCFCALISTAFSQATSKITGRVTDATGSPLAGATVTSTVSKNSTTTNNDGYFTISANSSDKLSVSYVGYANREIAINGRSNLSVELTISISATEEVVVVGYGTVKKSNLTGAVSTVKADELKKTPIASLDQGLQGRAAGVQVTQNSGAPGGAVSIRVRGGNSISSTNEPLYVIDGFPVSGSSISASGGVGYGSAAGNQPNALAGINPNDIESIEILKDASATAIYGSRGANGVVLITTKQGKKGSSRVDVETYYGLQQTTKKLKLLSPVEFAKYENTLAPGLYPNPENVGSGTDWQDELFHTAPIQNYQASISGGNDKTLFNFSTNYFDQQGIIIQSGFKRGSMRINLSHAIAPWIKIGTNLTLSKSENNSAPTADPGDNNGILNNALNAPPVIPVRTNTGAFTIFNDFNPRYVFTNNPVAVAYDVLNRYTTTRVLGNIFADVKLFEGLQYRLSMGSDILFDKRDSYIPRTVQAGLAANGIGGLGRLDYNSYLIENILNYTKNIGSDHTIAATAVISTQTQTSVTSSASTQGFPSDVLVVNDLSLGGTPNIGTGKSQSRLDSYTGRVNYSFKDKYLLSLIGRVDGSTRFGTDNKYGFFPSASFAWRIIDEGFMQDQKMFSDLKLRAGYGVTGNADIALYRSLFRLGTSGNFNYNFNNNRNVGIGPLSIPNGELKWEKSSSYNIGLDMSFIQNKLRVTIDAYTKSTEDLLLSRTIPSSSGFTSYFGNFGSVENKGIEFAVVARPINRTFSWDVSANLSMNRNKLTKVDGARTEIIPASNGGASVGAFLNSSILRVGQPVGSFYGYVFDGIWQTGDNITDSHMKTATPGNPRYVDVNGDKNFTDADRTIIGNPNPDFIFGLTNNFKYKNLDVSVFIQGSQGNDIFNASRLLLESGQGGRNQLAETVDRWTPTNPSNRYPKAVGAQRILQSTVYIEDGSYVRLKNLTIGYTLPLEKMGAKWSKRIRAYVSGNNFLTITKYTGFDPEVNTTGQNDVTNFGIDNNGYPIAKSFLFGLQVSF